MRNTCFAITVALIFLYACEKPSQKTQAKSESDGITQEIEAIENGLLRNIQIKGQALETYSLSERMEYHKVPGISIAVVKDGKLHWTKAYGIANSKDGTKVDTQTLFQAGSISKPLAALAALKLLEEGKVDLDTDVNTYLKDWKVPDSDFSKEEKVTLRRLLTHTAGMTVHGFPGYKPSVDFPSIETVLNGEGNTKAIFVDTTPGTKWRYSGGGYTVMEKIVEDISGMPLEEYMEKNILRPMGLPTSTYAQPLPENLHATASAAYDNKGKLIDGIWHNYPEQAAAGLWTTPKELAQYCMEIQQIYAGKEDGILSPETVKKMLSKDKNDWGLGPSLSGEGDSLKFGHGGKNAGFTNNMIAFANYGHALIIMTNADNGGRLIGEIARSISHYYNWGINKPTFIEKKDIDAEILQKFVGKFKYIEEVSGIGDYFVEIKVKDNQLIAIDDNDNEKYQFTHTGDLKFVDIEKGDRLAFSPTEDGADYTFLWDNYYKFERVLEE